MAARKPTRPTAPDHLTEAERDARNAFHRRQRHLLLAIVAWIGVAALCAALAIINAAART